MNTPIIAFYNWNQDEFVRAEVLSVRHSPAARKFFLIMRVIGMLIWLVGICIFFATESSWYELIFPVLLGAAFVSLPWFVGQWARKQYAKRNDRDMAVTWEIYDDRVVSKTEQATSSAPWTRYQKIVQAPEGFLLYPKDGAFQWLPTQAFRNPEGAGQFAELAGSKVKEFVRVV